MGLHAVLTITTLRAMRRTMSPTIYILPALHTAARVGTSQSHRSLLIYEINDNPFTHSKCKI